MVKGLALKRAEDKEVYGGGDGGGGGGTARKRQRGGGSQDAYADGSEAQTEVTPALELVKVQAQTHAQTQTEKEKDKPSKHSFLFEIWKMLKENMYPEVVEVRLLLCCYQLNQHPLWCTHQYLIPTVKP
jgi:hypothetical protein